MKRRHGIERFNITEDADYHIQRRVFPLIDPNARRVLQPRVVSAIVRSAYLQGAMDALFLADDILPSRKRASP